MKTISGCLFLALIFVTLTIVFPVKTQAQRASLGGMYGNDNAHYYETISAAEFKRRQRKHELPNDARVMGYVEGDGAPKYYVVEIRDQKRPDTGQNMRTNGPEHVIYWRYQGRNFSQIVPSGEVPYYQHQGSLRGWEFQSHKGISKSEAAAISAQGSRQGSGRTVSLPPASAATGVMMTSHVAPPSGGRPKGTTGSSTSQTSKSGGSGASSGTRPRATPAPNHKEGGAFHDAAQ